MKSIGNSGDLILYRTQYENVYAGGDAMRGASSLINAVGDGRKVAESILHHAGMACPAKSLEPGDERRPDPRALRQRQAKRSMGPGLPEKDADIRLNFDLFVDTLTEKSAKEEAQRCLQCDLVCNICSTVCPNRANLALRAPEIHYAVQRAEKTADGSVRIVTLASNRASQTYQIVNLADACNECGNCAIFCPSSGAPYKDKPRVHLSEASFAGAPDGFRLAAHDRLEGRFVGKSAVLTAGPDGFDYEDDEIKARLDGACLGATHAELKGGRESANLDRAVEMAVLYRLLAGREPFEPVSGGKA